LIYLSVTGGPRRDVMQETDNAVSDTSEVVDAKVASSPQQILLEISQRVVFDSESAPELVDQGRCGMIAALLR
jgi:hypothetical protein